MASLKDTKRRILSVKSTQKITKAMKLVSAAKYARANAAANNAKPYGQSFDELVKRLATACDDNIEIPFLNQRTEKKTLFIIVATDRGLCGGLNTNLFKECTKFLNERKKNGIQVDIVAWGKRSALYCKGRTEKIVASEEKVLDRVSYDFAKKEALRFAEQFSKGEYDKVCIAYSKFKNALSQEPTISQILPVEIEKNQGHDQTQFIYEPEMLSLLEGLLEKQMISKIHRVFLEGAASEHAARMAAMDGATNNASEVIRSLTLEYNRGRQAAITRELIEITSGAEAL